MPSTYHVRADDDIYRAVLEYEQQPMKNVPNPDYDPSGLSRVRDSWRATIRVPDGPVVTREKVIGTYTRISDIKSYITRNRSRYDNLRLKRIEKVSAWEEVDV